MIVYAYSEKVFGIPLLGPGARWNSVARNGRSWLIEWNDDCLEFFILMGGVIYGVRFL